VQFLMDAGNWAGALDLLERAPAGMPDLQTALIRSQILVKLGRAREAVDAPNAFSAKVDGPSGTKLKTSTFWYALLNAAQATGDENAVTNVLARLLAALPVRAGRAHTSVGKWFQDRGDVERAIKFFESAVGAGGSGNQAYLYLAEALVVLGRRDEARDLLDKLSPNGKGAEFLPTGWRASSTIRPATSRGPRTYWYKAGRAAAACSFASEIGCSETRRYRMQPSPGLPATAGFHPGLLGAIGTRKGA